MNGAPHSGHRGPWGRRGAWQSADLPDADDAKDWFTGRLPQDWFSDLDVTTDREEITVVGTLQQQADTQAGAEGVIARFRSDTREDRISIAQEAELRYRRKVAWGARAGSTTVLFTHLAVPVMTRLQQPERQVLDTLVDARVARSRADALAWCVRLTGDHIQEWLDQLRDAMSQVDDLRKKGPQNQ